MKNTEYCYVSSVEESIDRSLERWLIDKKKRKQAVKQHRQEAKVITRVWRKEC